MQELQDPQYKTADGSALRIWRDSAQNKFLSEKFGRPIFDEVIFVEAISPGSRDSTPVFEVERKYASEMAHPEPKIGSKYAEYRQYIDDFKKAETSDQSLAGTPLVQWPEMNRTLVATLKANNIYTVEALANLPDTRLIVVGPDGRTWREKATAYIESAKGSAYATALAAQLEVARADKADLQAQVTALANQIAALSGAQALTPPAGGVAQPQAALADPLAVVPALDPLAAPQGDATLAPAETAALPII